MSVKTNNILNFLSVINLTFIALEILKNYLI